MLSFTKPAVSTNSWARYRYELCVLLFLLSHPKVPRARTGAQTRPIVSTQNHNYPGSSGINPTVNYPFLILDYSWTALLASIHSPGSLRTVDASHHGRLCTQYPESRHPMHSRWATCQNLTAGHNFRIGLSSTHRSMRALRTCT